MYNVVLKALNKVIDVKNNPILNDKNLLNYLNKLALKKTIKEFKAKEKQPKNFFEKIKIVTN